ncbi:hypothetical protein D5086_020021 [Populus alba]|uniref:30S ribosomal protein 3, chloroplastic-like n=2 Tax=Populus alba TaxID=43335 RepID=A0A4U5QVL0_POPAL|nr:30S ribosomal protein 3-1, chloroplastic-like [Populus alba]TKS15110.1 hypothetical protein D5086_0000037770 [Populus alba]
MLSVAFQCGFSNVLTYPSLPCQTPSCKTFKATFSINPKPNLIHSSTFLDRKKKRVSRNQRYTISAAPEALTVETPTDTPPSTEAEESIPTQETEKAEVLVKQVEKPRLVLKFIWMEKNIGLALDQVIPGHGTVPLSPYFFWPRKDAWEELKATLESKPWISQKKMIILLNQATDIINLWQQSGGNLTTQ